MEFRFGDLVTCKSDFYDVDEVVIFTVIDFKKVGKGYVYSTVMNMNVPEQFRIVEWKESELVKYIKPEPVEPEIIEPEQEVVGGHEFDAECGCDDCEQIMDEVEQIEEELDEDLINEINE